MDANVPVVLTPSDLNVRQLRTKAIRLVASLLQNLAGFSVVLSVFAAIFACVDLDTVLCIIVLTAASLALLLLMDIEFNTRPV
jgi:hypothetical protein